MGPYRQARAEEQSQRLEGGLKDRERLRGELEALRDRMEQDRTTIMEQMRAVNESSAAQLTELQSALGESIQEKATLRTELEAVASRAASSETAAKSAAESAAGALADAKAELASAVVERDAKAEECFCLGEEQVTLPLVKH